MYLGIVLNLTKKLNFSFISFTLSYFLDLPFDC